MPTEWQREPLYKLITGKVLNWGNPKSTWEMLMGGDIPCSLHTFCTPVSASQSLIDAICLMAAEASGFSTTSALATSTNSPELKTSPEQPGHGGQKKEGTARNDEAMARSALFFVQAMTNRHKWLKWPQIRAFRWLIAGQQLRQEARGVWTTRKDAIFIGWGSIVAKHDRHQYVWTNDWSPESVLEQNESTASYPWSFWPCSQCGLGPFLHDTLLFAHRWRTIT